MRKIFSLFCTIILLIFAGYGFAIAPAKPGVQVPQIVIDIMQTYPERFYPKPALVYTMERYAQAKREALKNGIDDVDDVYGQFPVVCGKYADSGGDDWPVSMMQQQLFDGPWSTGTMREFYETISFDQFHLDGEVYGWYTSTLNQQYVVGNEYGFGPDAHLGEFLVELLNFADPEVDFSQYDNDGPDGVPNSGDDDGFVDSMFFIHDGAGGETGANNIWSHSYNLYWLLGGNYFITNDPAYNGGYIKIGPYIIQPSINSNGEIIEIGVFCHEFGHALGLPDLYDTDYTSEGIGVWGLMSGGSWNTPSKPAHMISWCRYKLGWIQPVEVEDYLPDQPITSLNTTGEAYKLWTEGSYGSEYFMIENRRREGFDIHLKGEGLLIWHVDENAQQSNEEHPLVDLEEADGLENLKNNVNSGDGGDPFPGVYDNRWFDEYSDPNSLDYYSQFTQVAVWDISDAAETMYANLDVIYSQPMFDIVDFEIDDSNGNNDGRADPGETVYLWITLENRWATANLITGAISTNSNYIGVIESTGFFGTINSKAQGNNEADPFRFSVASEAVEGMWISFTVHLIVGSFEQDLSIEMMIGRPPVLIVDDDLGEDYEQYIVESLEQTPYLYEVWDVEAIGSPGDETLKYDAIIWLTGDDYYTTLSSMDIIAVQSYIDNGGTFILTGQNINEDLGGTTFFTEYLKCVPDQADVNQLLLAGIEGSISEGMELLMVGTWGAGNQDSPSSVIPLDIAEPLFNYSFGGETGGVYYYNPLNDAHVVYLAFGLEAVSGMGSTTPREELLMAIFDWAQVPNAVEPVVIKSVPSEFVFQGVFPNPFNNRTEIRFSLPAETVLKITVYNLVGREIVQWGEGYYSPGEHSLIWDATDFASGIYLLNIAGEGINSTQKIVLLK